MIVDTYRIITRRLLPQLVFCLGMILSVTPTKSAVIKPEQFGMHFHGLALGNNWPTVPFGTLRLWDTNTTWNRLQPSRNSWSFDALDAYVSAAEARSTKLLMTLGQTPSWAAADPSSESPYGAGASSPPKDINDWKTYVRTLAERYKGRIQLWEIWNEIDVKHFYSGDFETLVQMEKAASEILKLVDPMNKVLTPSVQSGAFGKFEAYLLAGGGRYSDIISYHFYVPTGEPEDIFPYYQRVRAIANRHGLSSIPIWNTENGWLISNNNGEITGNQRPAWKSWRKLHGKNGADVVVRTYLILLSLGVDYSFWYGWDHGPMGLSENKGKVPKDAARGYTTAYRWLVGSDFRGCTRRGDVFTCVTERLGKASYILWSTKSENVNVPSSWNVKRVEDVFQQGGALDAQVVFVGPSPIRLSQ